MMTSTRSLLVIARPGRTRQGLQALLRTIPEIELVGQAACDADAIQVVVEQQPGLVLLDSSTESPDILAVLASIKRAYPQIGCIVLVETVQQQTAAKDAGADVTLIAGFNAEELRVAIGDALQRVRKSIGA